MNNKALIITILVLFLITVIICLYYYINYKNKNNAIRNININNLNDSCVDEITVYVLGTDMKKELYNNLLSLQKNGYNYKLIGYKEKWGGWRWRIQQYINTIKEHIKLYGENSIIIFIDGYDAIACKNKTGLKEIFIF